MEINSLQEAWKRDHNRLVALAAGILGDHAGAEDAVQEAFLRFSGQEEIDAPGAWLTVVVTRLCLDRLRSLSARTERAYDGSTLELISGNDPDPLDRAALDESIRIAASVVLGALGPAERVSLMLHDVFGLSFPEVAEILHVTHASARQLASRARKRIANRTSEKAAPTTPAEQEVVDRFIAACAAGDVSGMVAVLSPAVWGIATFLDGGPTMVNQGAGEVATNILRFLAPPIALVPVGATLHAFNGYRWNAVISLAIADRSVQAIDSLVAAGPATG